MSPIRLISPTPENLEILRNAVHQADEVLSTALDMVDRGKTPSDVRDSTAIAALLVLEKLLIYDYKSEEKISLIDRVHTVLSESAMSKRMQYSDSVLRKLGMTVELSDV